MIQSESLDWAFGKKLRLIRQTESSECGLACLAMITDWFGFKIDLPSLRSRYHFSKHGLSLQDIMKCAEDLHLSSRPLHASLDDLKQLDLPCVLHWNMNHFVVLNKVTNKYCEIYDPAHGVIKYSIDQVDKYYTGIALELSPNHDFQKLDLREHVKIRDLIGKTQGIKSALTKIFTFAVALEMLALISPLINQIILDEVLVSFDYGLLNLVIVGLILLSITQAIVSLARQWFTIYLSVNFNMQWAANVFHHLIRLPIDWYEKRELGDISAKFDSLNTIQNVITNNLIQALLDLILVIGTVTIMFFYSPKLTLVCIASASIYALIRIVWFERFKRAEEDIWTTNAKEQSHFLETIHGILSVRINGGLSWRENSWKNFNIARRNAQLNESRLVMIYSVFIDCLVAFTTAAVLWFGANLVLSGDFTAGMLVAFLAFQIRFSTSITDLINNYFEFKMLSVHTERLADIVLHPKERQGKEVVNYPKEFAELSDIIDVNNLSFRYSDNSPLLFQNLSFSLKKGEILAITGRSGCGKTTLAKILLGLYLPNTGSVEVLGNNTEQCDLHDLRLNIGSVFQDDQLFNGSILSNICFFSQEVDMEKAIECAKLASIHDEIEAMTMGYETLVGEMGGSISGGQKQRIIFARALYKDPKLLILDEATSHLDITNEKSIIQAIRSLKIPVIQIAHRKETIESADRVINLDNYSQ